MHQLDQTMKSRWWIVIGQAISWHFFPKYKTACLKENRKFFLGLPLWRKSHFGPLGENAFSSSLKTLMKQHSRILNTKCMFDYQDCSTFSDVSSNQTSSMYKKEKNALPVARIYIDQPFLATMQTRRLFKTLSSGIGGDEGPFCHFTSNCSINLWQNIYIATV